MEKFIKQIPIRPLVFSLIGSIIFCSLWDFPVTCTWSLDKYFFTLGGFVNYLFVLLSLTVLILSIIFALRLWIKQTYSPEILGAIMAVNPLTVSFLSTHNLLPLLCLILICLFVLTLATSNKLLLILLALILKIYFTFFNLYLLAIIASVLIFAFTKTKNRSGLVAILILLCPATPHLNALIKSIFVTNDQYLISLKDFYPYNLWSKMLMGLMENYYTTTLGLHVLQVLTLGSLLALIFGNRSLRILTLSLFFLILLSIPSRQSFHFRNTLFHLNVLHLPLLKSSVLALNSLGLLTLFIALSSLVNRFMPRNITRQSVVYGLILLALLLLTPSFLIGTLML